MGKVYRLPGLSLRATAVVMELAEREFPDGDTKVGRPWSLTLDQAVRMTLVRLRRNHTDQALGEDFGVTRQTAWNNIQVIVGFLVDVLGCESLRIIQKSLVGTSPTRVCASQGTVSDLDVEF